MNKTSPTGPEPAEDRRKLDQFIRSNTGHRLLSTYPVDKVGLWQIKGEDLGSTHQPDLGIVSGRLDDVIRYAVELGGFWRWGAGGDILEVKVKKIDAETIKKEAALRKRKAKLEAELAEINRKLPNN